MILEAIIKKASSVQSLTKYDDILAAVGKNMKTNMTFGEMKSLAVYLKGGMPKVDSLSLKGYDDMSTGVYYYKLDSNNLAEIKQTLQNQLGLNDNNSNNSQTGTTNNTNTNDSGTGNGSNFSSDYNSNYNTNNGQ